MQADYTAPLPWTYRILALLVIPNLGYFQTIRIYDFRIPGIADTPHTPTTQYLSIFIVFQLSLYLLLLLPPIPHCYCSIAIALSQLSSLSPHPLTPFLTLYHISLYILLPSISLSLIPKSLCSYQSLVFHLSSLHRFPLINSHYI